MDLGDTLPFRSDLYDAPFVEGQPPPNLVNAASVTLTITLPDGTTVSPTVTNPPAITGKYRYDYATSPASPQGKYTGHWQFTMAGGAPAAYEESFDVGPSLITTDEAVAHLRAAGIITSENDLDELQWLTMVATDAVERDLGRVIVPRTVVETHDGNSGVIELWKSPVISVTSVTEGGAPLSGSFGYVLKMLADGSALIERGSQLVPQYFWWGRQNVVVTYRAGYVDPPRIVRKVALNVVQGMWQSSQQSYHPSVDDASGFLAPAQGALTPVEQAAYDSLRLVGVG